VEEERIKSAFELAMERISSLPELTPEEFAAQKEKQHGPLGEAAAGRYLNGAINDDELSGEVSRYGGEQLRIVRKAAVSSFSRALRLDAGPDTAAKALKGIGLIAAGKRALIDQAAEDFNRVRRDYERECRKRSSGFEASVLGPLGISGPAVRFNLAVNNRWLEELQKIRKDYEPDLEALRAAVMRGVESP